MTGLLAALRLLPGSVKVGLVSLLVLGVFQVQRGRERRELERQLATARAASGQLEQHNATLRLQVSQVVANRDALVQTVREQNAAVTALRLTAEQATAAARAAALTALRAGDARRRALETPAPVAPGAEDMNQWMRDTFSPQ